jgi:hypothetical protein
MGSRARLVLVGGALLAGVVWVASRDFDGTTAEAVGPPPQPVVIPPANASQATVAPKPELAAATATGRVALEGPKATAPTRSISSAVERLEPTADEALIRVLVVEKETNEPIAGAQLMLTQDGHGGGLHVDRARARKGEIPRTGEDGRGEFIVPAEQEFEVSATGAVSEGSEQVPALVRGATCEIVVRLPTRDDFAMFVRVVTAEDGSPIRDASLQLQSGSGYGPPNHARAVGTFELSGASWRDEIVRVEAPGFAPRCFNLVSGYPSADRAYEVRLARVASLVAHVTGPSGAPVAGVEVRLSTSRFNLFEPGSAFFLWSSSLSEEDPHWTATTGDDGRCTVVDLPPSAPLSMELRQEGSANQSEPALTLEAGERREIELVIGGGVELHGIVLDQSSEPVAEQRIVLLRPDHPDFIEPTLLGGWGDIVCQATTDAQGRFTMPGVSAGTWLIGPSTSDRGLSWLLKAGRSTGSARRHPDERRVACLAIPIEVGRVSPQEIELRVDRGLYIRGRVLDSMGAPAEGSVTGFRQDELLVGTWPRAELANGTFTLGPLPAGRWQLTASGNDGDAESEPVVVDAGEQDVLLRLRAGCSLRGEVVNGGTGLRRRAEVDVHVRGQEFHSWSTMVDDSGFSIGGLPAGTYGLFARDGDDVGRLANVALAPGENRTGLRIELEPGARLRFTNRSARSGFCSVEFDGYRIGGFVTEAGGQTTEILPSGRARLHLHLHPKYEVAERTFEVELVAGEEREITFEDEQR